MSPEKEITEKKTEEQPELENNIEEVDIEEITEKKEKKEKKDEKIGIVHIKSSSNNTIIHITDLAGNTISRISGGMITKHSRLKSNPTVAMFAAKRVAERAKDLGFTKFYVRMRGKTGLSYGPGVHAAVKSLNKEGFEIINILDTTKIPRGGPKKKGGRRGRRV